MDNSQNTGPRSFDPQAWGSGVVFSEPDRVWFESPEQKVFAIIFLIFAFFFLLVSAGIFLERKGLKASLTDMNTLLMGIASLVLALGFAMLGLVFLLSTNRVGLLDLANVTFSAVYWRSGKPKRAFSCSDLYIHIVETVRAEGDCVMRGRISIVGPEKPDSKRVPPEVNGILFFSLCDEDFFKTVRELEKVASWKGLIGDDTLIKLYKSGW